MCEQAAHLVDRVLRPELRWRQWVVTFPRDLAIGLCFQPDLCSAVLRVCMRVLLQWFRDRSAPITPAGVRRVHPAAVVFVQRFSDGAGPWMHFHVLAADGVFCERAHSLAVSFSPHPPPTQTELAALVRRLAARVRGLCARRGVQPVGPDGALLHDCASAPAQTIRRPRPPPSRARHVPLCARHDDFGLHAGVSIPPGRPAALERLCRYMARPAIAQTRLTQLDDDRVVLTLKRPRGPIKQLVFDPVAFVARLAALVPPPNRHLTRFWGALAPGSPIRAAAVPPPDATTPERPTAPKRPNRMRWNDLLQRVFLVDALLCPCGGTLKPLGIVRNPDVAQAILAAIVLSHQAPARAPPRRLID